VVEALESMFQYRFTELGLERIILRTLKENKPMKGLLERKLAYRRRRGRWKRVLNAFLR